MQKNIDKIDKKTLNEVDIEGTYLNMKRQTIANLRHSGKIWPFFL